MALIPPRTPADDVADALRRLDALERELPNLRAHLQRAYTDPQACAMHAERVGRIVAAIADEVVAFTRDAAAYPRAVPGPAGFPNRHLS